jgi:hypothetical protein
LRRPAGGGAASQQAARLEPSPHAQLSGGFLQLQRPELLAGRSVTAMAYCAVAGSSLVACAYAPVSMAAEQRLKVCGVLACAGSTCCMRCLLKLGGVEQPQAGHGPRAEGSSCPSQDHSPRAQGLLCVWDLQRPQAPAEVLLLEGSPTACCWAPAASGAGADLLFAGGARGQSAGMGVRSSCDPLPSRGLARLLMSRPLIMLRSTPPAA